MGAPNGMGGGNEHPQMRPAHRARTLHRWLCTVQIADHPLQGADESFETEEQALWAAEALAHRRSAPAR
jgi:hypothetical protein